MADLSPEGFEVLRAAVTVARDRQIHSVHVLRHTLKGMGYGDEAIAEALVTWGRYAVDPNGAARTTTTGSAR